MHAFLCRGLQGHENATGMDYHRCKYLWTIKNGWKFSDIPPIKKKGLLSLHLYLVRHVSAQVKECGENDTLPIEALKTGRFYLGPLEF